MTGELQVTLPTTFGVATYPPGASFGPRALRDWEFVWMIEGDAVYQRGGVETAADEGSIVLCQPGATDFFQWDAKRRTRHGYFHFGVAQLPDDWPTPEVWPVVRLPDNDDILRPLFRHLLAWDGSRNHGQCRLTVAHLLTAFVSGDIGAGDVPRPVWPEPVERAWAFLHQSLEDAPDAALPLIRLAAAACVTPEHLCRLFKAATGRTPAETVRLARLDRALVLLARSNYNVGEIARLCGFPSVFHFSRRFAAAFGQTPSAVRRAVQSGQTPPAPRLRHSQKSISQKSISDKS